ncbi:MAG: hypothetical protein WBA57_21330 [Elainellaceae cyanobacterium]
MDIQATLFDLLDAYERGDREAIDELLQALAEWNERGGFMPTVYRVRAISSTFQISRYGKREIAQGYEERDGIIQRKRD